MSKLITVDEVAARYGVAPVTVRRWAKAGAIKGMRIGRHTLFTQEAVDEFERASAIAVPRAGETELQAYHRAKREVYRNGRTG